MRNWITKLISPRGEIFWEAYGPMTKDRSKAMRFSNQSAAEKAALNRFGRGGMAFWESERQWENRAREQYRDWSYEVEPEIVAATNISVDLVKIAEELVSKYPDTPPTEQERKLWREQAEERRRQEGIRPRKAGSGDMSRQELSAALGGRRFTMRKVSFGGFGYGDAYSLQIDGVPFGVVSRDDLEANRDVYAAVRKIKQDKRTWQGLPIVTG